MTIQTIAGLSILIPEFSGTAFQAQATGGTQSVGTVFTFDAATDVLALVTRVPKTGTLTGLDFRTGTVSTAGATFDFGLRSVTDGLPNISTDLVANSSSTVAVAITDDNVWKSVSLNAGAGVSVTRGALCAMVLKVSSGTPNTVIIAGMQSNLMVLSGFPYKVEDTAGTLARALSTLAVPFAWNYGGTYAPADGCAVGNSGAFVTPGNGAERGLRFKFPVPVNIAGVRMVLANMAAGADFRIVLYDNDGTTVLAQVESTPADIDGDTNVGATVDAAHYFPFATSPSFTANEVGYVCLFQKTAAVIQSYEIAVSDVKYMDAMPGGKELYLVNRAVGGSGAFTETTTTRFMAQLVIDGLDDGAGAGGGLRLAGHGGLAA